MLILWSVTAMKNSKHVKCWGAVTPRGRDARSRLRGARGLPERAPGASARGRNRRVFHRVFFCNAICDHGLRVEGCDRPAIPGGSQGADDAGPRGQGVIARPFPAVHRPYGASCALYGGVIARPFPAVHRILTYGYFGRPGVIARPFPAVHRFPHPRGARDYGVIARPFPAVHRVVRAQFTNPLGVIARPFPAVHRYTAQFQQDRGGPQGRRLV